ncbi:unnamed protein product, partial [Ectocarpus sp. 4 AP-2014]
KERAVCVAEQLHAATKGIKRGFVSFAQKKPFPRDSGSSNSSSSNSQCVHTPNIRKKGRIKEPQLSVRKEGYREESRT